MIFIEGRLYPVSRDLVAIPSKEYECILSREDTEKLLNCSLLEGLNSRNLTDIRVSNPHKYEIKIVSMNENGEV